MFQKFLLAGKFGAADEIRQSARGLSSCFETPRLTEATPRLRASNGGQLQFTMQRVQLSRDTALRSLQSRMGPTDRCREGTGLI